MTVSFGMSFGWLVGCFGFNGPLRQYFSLYRAVSQRAGERGEKGQSRVKMSKQPPPVGMSFVSLTNFNTFDRKKPFINFNHFCAPLPPPPPPSIAKSQGS